MNIELLILIISQFKARFRNGEWERFPFQNRISSDTLQKVEINNGTWSPEINNLYLSELCKRQQIKSKK
jgi:hypothetical protein